MQLKVIIFFVAVGWLIGFGQSPLPNPEWKPVDPYIPAIIRAVEDEIYDLHYEGKYFLIDDQDGGDSKPAKISIYISKLISHDGAGVAIYKLMPNGQVYRHFVVQDNGLVVLLGEPQMGFLPDGGSELTVYMTEDQVCDFIRHDTTKTYFTVDPNVSKQRLKEAIQGQLERDGFSYRQYRAKHPRKKRPTR